MAAPPIAKQSNQAGLAASQGRDAHPFAAMVASLEVKPAMMATLSVAMAVRAHVRSSQVPSVFCQANPVNCLFAAMAL
jgi:hypothetical protein